MSVKTPAVGLVLGTAIPPEGVCEAAAASERIGFDELWLLEDYSSRAPSSPRPRRLTPQNDFLSVSALSEPWCAIRRS